MKTLDTRVYTTEALSSRARAAVELERPDPEPEEGEEALRANAVPREPRGDARGLET